MEVELEERENGREAPTKLEEADKDKQIEDHKSDDASEADSTDDDWNGLDYLHRAIVYGNIPSTFVMAILVTFLTDSWKMELTHAAAIVNLQIGIMRILTVLMAYLVETCVVSRTMFNLGNALLCIGLGFLSMSDPSVLSTGSCNASEPVCIGRVQYALFYSGLCLITVGMSGQWIGLNAFLVGQKVQSEHQLLKEESMFDFNNFTLACDPLYLIISGTAFGIQYVNPWPLKFGIPTILNVVFALLALCISYSYTPSPPRGSNLTRVYRVFVAATRKMNIRHPNDVQQLHKRNDDEVLLHTKFFRFLNRAAIVAPSPPPPDDQIKDKWKLCCIEEVEDTKVMIRMVPKYLPFIITGLVISVGSTFFMEQGNNMSRRLGRIKVPLVTLFIFSETASVYWKVIYECLSIFSEDEDENPRTRQRSNWYVLVLKYIIGVGMVFAVLCCIVAALVEKKRINVIKGHGLLDKPDFHIK